MAALAGLLLAGYLGYLLLAPAAALGYGLQAAKELKEVSQGARQEIPLRHK